VRLPAKLTLGSVMALPSWIAWGGRSALPLEPGTVDALACQQALKGKRQSQPGIRPLTLL
jgi:hypothetical protein